MFTALLLTIAKKWKQPKSLSIGERIEILPFGTIQMDLEGIMLGETSQTRERQIPYNITYMQNLKKIKQMNTQNKTETES